MRLRLYPVTAAELLRAAQEADTLSESAETRGLCRNACLLASAVRDGRGRRVYRSGSDVLARLTAETVACWTAAYAELVRPSEPEEERRVRWKVLKAFGVLPTERRAKRLRGDKLAECLLQMELDAEEQLADVCPSCRESLLTRRCPVCGELRFEENPIFDAARFEELKHGLSRNTAAR